LNGEFVLNWLIEDAERNANDYYPDIWENKLEDQLYELNSRREIDLPAGISLKDPPEEKEAISILKDTFKNRTSYISLILNYVYPEKYIFYRVSMLETEIFSGFKFLSDIYDKFQFDFYKIGQNKDSIDNYLKLNEAMRSFAIDAWPDTKDKSIHKNINYFIYQGLGSLFLDRNGYNRYWIMATGDEHFNSLDSMKEVIWSGRKEMQVNDLVFMYRQAPRKAITDIYFVSKPPYFDPYGAWGGFWVPLKKITPIKDITMVEMKHDSILGKWGFAKCSSQGVVTAPVPYSIYNRLLELIGKDVCKKNNLISEPLAKAVSSGLYASEEDFEDDVLEPLFRNWGLKFQRQYPCYFTIGTQYHTCFVDFIVHDAKGTVTLFEDKIEIRNDAQLQKAISQAKSYSLLLGINSFVIASPEGFWIYRLDKNNEILLEKISSDEFKEKEERMREMILKLRNNAILMMFCHIFAEQFEEIVVIIMRFITPRPTCPLLSPLRRSMKTARCKILPRSQPSILGIDAK
jgi:hypothetical protein